MPRYHKENVRVMFPEHVKRETQGKEVIFLLLLCEVKDWHEHVCHQTCLKKLHVDL